MNTFTDVIGICLLIGLVAASFVALIMTIVFGIGALIDYYDERINR